MGRRETREKASDQFCMKLYAIRRSGDRQRQASARTADKGRYLLQLHQLDTELVSEVSESTPTSQYKKPK
ncbi:MAG: hypothetical protein F6J93_24705 [Oscillatoria sp. SIO1A7]|nr:hypothetical protein [Oscillatoria sp. SIO1A7]